MDLAEKDGSGPVGGKHSVANDRKAEGNAGDVVSWEHEGTEQR